MNDLTPRKATGSLLERAAEIYDFGAHLRARQGDFRVEPGPEFEPGPGPEPEPEAERAPQLEPRHPPMAEAPPESQPIRQPMPAVSVDKPLSGPRPAQGGAAVIDRALLSENGLLVPGAAVGAPAEEFRQVKRQLLQTARAVRAGKGDRSRTVLVCSAKPNDGKTYCAINLAISMAAERDIEVVLVDADFAKPDVMKRLGLNEGPGLLDALADPQVDINACVVPTDIPQLSLLSAGTKSNTDTELLASARTGELIQALLDADPKRLVIFDSPPALAASPASVLANHAGQVMLVVRADRTVEGDLREAVALLDGCEHIQLVLNAVTFAPGGRRFGSYYGQEDAE
jgi:protein-tyrosine kinase